MADLDLCYLSIAEASRRIASGELSPVALTQAVLQRIDETDAAVHSFVRLMRESALEAAAASERRARDGARLGPLDGIPIGVKDLIDTAGVVTTGGTGAYRQRVPQHDATCIRLLKAAGAIIIGKTNTHELALGGTTTNAHYGATHNPWSLDRVPGGSSGGSASALAAGQCLGALGTDTAGSIRLPAAFCGVTGHKPTYGLVSRAGVLALSATLDHTGPMTRSAEDAALLLGVLAGYDAADLDSMDRPSEDYAASLGGGVRGLRLAVVPSQLEGCAPAVLANFQQSLEVLRGLGAIIGACEPLAGIDLLPSGRLSLVMVEAEVANHDILTYAPAAVAEDIRTRMLSGLEVRGVDYFRASQIRKRIERQFAEAMREWHAIVLPTAPVTAEPIGSEPPTQKFRITTLFDLSRQPAITVPNGLDADGLPTGLHMATRQWTDALTLRIAHAYQQATGHHRQRPPLA